MTPPIRPADDELMRRIIVLERQVYALTLGQGSGRHSLGIDALKPGVKAGTPSDADFVTATMPAIGTRIYDTTGSRIWVRHSAGTWKSVVVA